MSWAGSSESRGRGFGWIAGGLIGAVYIVNVAQYAFHVDDAFISFRYALNLVEGHGLVWNPGERVEGYTNFLWVLLMAASLAVGVSAQSASSALGIASGVGILVALVVLSARLWGWRSSACWLAPAALVLSRSFTAWSTGGLATQFFSLLVFVAFVVLFAERRRESTHPLGSSLLFGLAALTRPEGLLFAAVAGGFQLLALGRRREFRALAWWLFPLTAIVAAHFLWRYSYYGEWLPNTFYVKVAGFSPEKSIPYLRLFLQDYALHWFLPFALIGSLVERRLTVERGLFLAAASLYIAYVFYIGGGLFEFRFLVPVFPMVYWLIADGIRAFASVAIAGGGSWLPRTLAVAAAASLLATTHLGSVKPEAKLRRGAVTSIPLMRLYAKNRAHDGKFLRALVVSGRLAPDTRIAVSGAGALPYYSRLFSVDTLGLNDSFVARQSINQPGVIGHEHVATTDYLISRKVAIHDVMNRLIFRGPPEALPRSMAGRPLRCVRVDDRYLLFATMLSDEAFDIAFERFDRVF